MNQNREIVYYTDFRKFLRDYYESRKNKMKSFSYRTIAERAGFASPSFIKEVIDGNKNLTKTSIIMIARALKLNKKATDYFENIVFFTQAKDLETKEIFLEKIDAYRKRNKPELLLAGEYDYLKNWIHAVIREVVELPDFEEDPEKIAKKLLVDIKPQEIKKSLEFLINHGFLKRDSNGKLVKLNKTLSTGDIPFNEEMMIIARKYHLSIISLAANAVSNLPRDKRNVISGAFSMSKSTYEIACKRIESLFYELLEMAQSDKNVDNVYQLNINLFPMTKDRDEK